MKKLILTISILLGTLIMGIAGLLFSRPEYLINPSNLNYVLKKKSYLKKWSWEDAEISHEWIKWNVRGFRGQFKNFCYQYHSDPLEIETCMDVSWNLVLNFNIKEGFKFISKYPLKIRSKQLKITLNEGGVKKSESDPPDVYSYWKVIWSRLIPRLDVKIEKIAFLSKGRATETHFKLMKNDQDLTAAVFSFQLWATPNKVIVTGPQEYKLPFDLEGLEPLYLRAFQLSATVKEEGISLQSTGSLEAMNIEVKSFLKLPLKDGPASLSVRKSLLLETKVSALFPDIKKGLEKYAPKSLNELPAPLNSMNGSVHIKASAAETDDTDVLTIFFLTRFNLESAKQMFDVNLNVGVPLNVKNFSKGQISIGINFNKVLLQLPRLSKKGLPPQFFPDPRIKTAEAVSIKKTKKKKVNNYTLELKTAESQAVHIKSNLLDEDLRLNFDLLIKGGNIQNGHLRILPLKTKVFKRPIHVTEGKIIFNHPIEPVIVGTVLFPLPEYKITLKIKGPLSRPRHAFSSEPPLPQSDIYSVLLFGRPMTDLEAPDKAAAQQTNKILSQGLLTLSVLYFLAGSPVEYVGFDPTTKEASAQIGLGTRNSLRVGGGKEGVSSTGVRRSLGSGWYLDTSVQNRPALNDSESRNYGVLLERIISY